MATVTIDFSALAGVNFNPAVTTTVAQFLNTFTDTPISISTTATGRNLTSIGVFDGGNTVWRLRNGTGSPATSSNLSRSGGGFSKTLDLPANTDTFVRSTGGGTHILKIGSFVNTKAANPQTINTTNTSSTGTTRIALLDLADSYNITGSNSNDTLTGANAADTINGGQGNDTLTGGGGNDSLTGGTGADRFAYTASNQGIDTITDFTTADSDAIQISASGTGFSGSGLNVGTLNATEFLSGAGATSATTAAQRFIYNTTDGGLRFDADGSAGGFAPVQLATLTNLPGAFNQSYIVIVA